MVFLSPIYQTKSKIVKAVFSEENYVPQPQIESILYCVPMIQAEIHQYMRKHNFGQTLKLQIAMGTLNIR